MEPVPTLIRAALIVSFLTLLSTHSNGVADESLLGQGNVSCRAWSDDRRIASPFAEPRTAWMLGFLTAFSQYGATPATDVSRGKSTDELTAWIDRYCGGHPNETLHEAASALVEALREEAKP